jgi:hypothetical protein
LPEPSKTRSEEDLTFPWVSAAARVANNPGPWRPRDWNATGATRGPVWRIGQRPIVREVSTQLSTPTGPMLHVLAVPRMAWLSQSLLL